MDIVSAVLDWIASNKETIGLIVGSGLFVSVTQWVINRWLSSKKIIHTSLLILSTVLGLGDLAVMYSGEILHLLPAAAAGVFTSALTFYRFVGKGLFARIEQHFLDARTGRALRQPEPVPNLQMEEFSTSVA